MHGETIAAPFSSEPNKPRRANHSSSVHFAVAVWRNRRTSIRRMACSDSVRAGGGAHKETGVRKLWHNFVATGMKAAIES